MATDAPRDEPIGLIAGQGALPLHTARGMRAAGRRVCCVGLSGQFDPELRNECDRFRAVGLFRVGQWIRALRRMDVHEAVMIGRVGKTTMHDPWRFVRYVPDIRTLRLWYKRLRHDHRTPAILGAIAQELASGGIDLIDSTRYIPEHLARGGVMTRTQPGPLQRGDIEFGWSLLNKSIELGIGQSIAVCERDVIAVEAVEGTTRMIERAGALCHKRPWTLMKTSGPDHDRRSDVPTIGQDTIRAMHECGGRCIAVGEGDVIIVERDKTIELADELGIAIVGIARA
ncbi:MAG: LpxI family protein [Phycisphaerales bacterium JB043]